MNQKTLHVDFARIPNSEKDLTTDNSDGTDENGGINSFDPLRIEIDERDVRATL